MNLLAPLLFVILSGGLSAAAMSEDSRAACPMVPSRVLIQLPPSGVVWLEGSAFSGPCEKVPAKEWRTAPAGRFNLMLHADGPSGSGRFWNVTVALSDKGGTKPKRGFCLDTWTVGWRTLQKYERTPLPWVADLDGEASAELLIWDSFALGEDPSLAEYALVAWVYVLDSDGNFVLDWGLTRELAKELATAYRAPTTEGGNWADPLRLKASQNLEAFAEERCRPTLPAP